MYEEMKNWWRNKGQITKNGHLKLVSYTFKKQPDFSQELGICQLPACSGGKTGRCRPSKNPLGAYVLPRAAVFSLPLTACAGLRINGKSIFKLPLAKFLSQLFLCSSSLQEIYLLHNTGMYLTDETDALSYSKSPESV